MNQNCTFFESLNVLVHMNNVLNVVRKQFANSQFPGVGEFHVVKTALVLSIYSFS